jgi:predicted nucleic acid-binding protein
MNDVFADTSYYVALLNPKDQLHARAAAWAATIHEVVLTTDYVLVEVANFFSRARQRDTFRRLIENVRSTDDVIVIPSSRPLWEDGYKLFLEYADKDWSLTDCTSFHVMRDRGITDALTADVHFAQAGFRPLLFSDPA